MKDNRGTTTGLKTTALVPNADPRQARDDSDPQQTRANGYLHKTTNPMGIISLPSHAPRSDFE